LVVSLVNSVRSEVLRDARVWERVVLDGADWALRVEDDFELPVSPNPPLRRSPDEGIGVLFERAAAMPEAELKRQWEAERAVLLAVRARNRPDDWERLCRG
jgi:hypothetical protein